MSTAESWDAVVVGGGPAGAAAARLLSTWGHQVVVVTRPPRHTLAESLPPSIRRLLGALDLQEAVDRAPFYPATGNTVWWGGSPCRSEMFPDRGTGYQVDRAVFDQLLLDAAESAGATVLREAIREVCPGDDEGTVGYAGGRLRARWVLDCSGRAGVLARRGLRRTEPGITTFALYAVWRHRDWNLPDPSHTIVESYSGGWGWSVPVSPAVRYVTAMVDPEASGLARGRRVETLYRAELQRTTHLRALIRDAELVSVPGGLSASPYGADRYAGPGWLLVGDAGSFIDPLSSFGVKKALASAWLAAVVVHTALLDSAMAAPALGLFESREKETYAALTRQAAALFAEGAEAHAHAFWDARWGSEASSRRDEPDVGQLRRDPDVLAALERLKRAPAISLRPGGAVRLVPRPVVREHRVVLEDHVQSAWIPKGVRYLRGVNLPRLLALAPAFSQVPDLYEGYNRVEPWATLPDFLGVLSVLLAKGVLVQSDATLTAGEVGGTSTSTAFG